MQVPLAQVVGPSHPLPPHWPYKGAPLDAGKVDVDVLVGVLPGVAEVVPVGAAPSAEFITSSNTGNMRDAIMASPSAFG